MDRFNVFGCLIALALLYVSGSAYATDLELTGTISGNYYNVDDIYTSGPCVVVQGSSATLTTLSTVTLNSGFHVVLGGSFIVNMADTDSDGLLDNWEIQYFGNLYQGPNDDYDHDGLTNLQECQAGTDPTKTDTDNDGISDAWEVAYSLNPLNPSDAGIDSDGDGYTNYLEYLAWTNPRSSSSHPGTTVYNFGYDENGNLTSMGQ